MNKLKNLLNIKNVSKSFPGIKALDKVDLELKQGEVHVLVGENGAGKSTLVKIISGLYKTDEGEMFYRDGLFEPETPRAAMESGVRVIYQELSLISSLTAAENIFFEKLPRSGLVVDNKRLNKDASELLKAVGLEISPSTETGTLGIAQQQQVEIAKALSGESSLIIMDEPTATLTSRETEKLFGIIRNLKEQGKTILYISHRLNEIFEIGDRVTILRNGQVVETKQMSEVSVEYLVKKMVGKSIGKNIPFYDDQKPDLSFPLLEVEKLKRKGIESDISFSLYPGEILGIAGLVGSGRTEMIRTLYGLEKKESGDIKIKSIKVNINNPQQAAALGIGLVTEDRKDEGLLLPLSSGLNLTITNLKTISDRFLLNKKKEFTHSKKLIDELQIRLQGPHQQAGTLSGGNQQKLVVGKWLYRNCDIFIFDEPTRGIDVGAKYEIYNLLWALAAEGKGIIVVSSEIEEIMGLCHRILVFSKNEISQEFNRKDFSQEEILTASYKNYL